MIEEIVELINDENYNELKKFIKKNYNEIGSLIFAICVSAQELDRKLLNSYIAIIKVLIDNGHKCDYVDENGNTALLAAISSQIYELVILFDTLDNLFTQPNVDEITPIALSFTLKDEDIKNYCAMKIKNHINDIFPINGKDMTYFSLSILTCSSAICKLLSIHNGFDYNIHQRYLNNIKWDDSDEDTKKRELLNLLSKGDSVLPEEYEEYNEGGQISDIECMDRGISPLMLAVYQNDYDRVKELINDGAKVNYRNSAGFNPLFVAYIKNNYKIAKYLIDKGAFVNVRLYNGISLLIIAALSDNEKLFNLLLDKNIYISDLDYKYLAQLDNYEKKYKKLLATYPNLLKKKTIFPYEYMYNLDYVETFSDEDYYDVVDVFAENWGTNMITLKDCYLPFGMCPCISRDMDSKHCKTGVSFRGPSEYYSNMNVAILHKNGIVKKINTTTLVEKSIFKNEDIVQIESTNYNIVGLTKDGRVLIDNNKIPELEVVNEWKSIKKIATSFSSIFAITESGEFKYALSNIDKLMFKFNDIEDFVNNTKCEKLIDIDAHDFQLGVVTHDGKVKLIANLESNDEKAVNAINDAIQISVNDHFAILLKNKTVLTFGSFAYNQCNVTKWHDIERVQTTHFGTIGYATNGKIISTDCMFQHENMDNDESPLNNLFNSALWSEGFSCSTSIGNFVPDAITLISKGEN